MVITPIRPPALATTEARPVTSPSWRGALSSRVYLPAFAVGGLAAALVVAGWCTGWGGEEFVDSMRSLQLVVVGPASLTVLVLILVIERVRPAQWRSLVARGHRQDVLYTVFHGTVGLALITALTLSFEAMLRKAAPWIVLPRMAVLPHLVVIALILVAMDACNWAVHLANHRVRVLWRFHELHHSQEDLNALTVFRTHPLIHVSYLGALLPLVVLLANGALSTAVLVVYGGIVTFAHSNTNLGFGPLGRLLVSPNYHRLHHRLEGAQDVNLGFVFTIWDQLSHRAVFPTPETARIATGIPGRPLPVEQEGEKPRHMATFAAQLLGPFRPMTEPSELPSIKT